MHISLIKNSFIVNLGTEENASSIVLLSVLFNNSCISDKQILILYKFLTWIAKKLLKRGFRFEIKLDGNQSDFITLFTLENFIFFMFLIKKLLLSESNKLLSFNESKLKLASSQLNTSESSLSLIYAYEYKYKLS